MPKGAGKVKKPDEPERLGAGMETDMLEAEEETGSSSSKAEIIERLKAQGAVRVFPMAGPATSSGPAAAEKEAEPAADSASQSDDWETRHQAWLEQTDKQVDEANNPAWYNLPQRVRNLRHGRMDLSQGRSRSGGREQDYNLEEDVRTNRQMGKMDPGMFDVKQHISNAIGEASGNKMATAAGMIPVVGGLAKQGIMEQTDVRRRNLQRGVAATEHSDGAVKDEAAADADATHQKIRSGRIKAGIGTVTGALGKAGLPGAGAVSAGAGFLVDRAHKDANKRIISSRAREKARQEMRQAEYGGYEGVGEYMALEKMRGQLEKLGAGDEDSGAASMISPEMHKRLMAHTSGQIPHAKDYAKHAKTVEKQRAAALKEGMEFKEPKPEQEGAGMLSKFKKFFKRSS